MPGKRRGIPASQLARDYAVSLTAFVSEVTALLARLEGQDASAMAPARRREICAAVSAAMTASLDASTLTREEREKLDPLLSETLLPFWNKHCAGEPDAAAYIDKRAAYYLAKRDPVSQVRTAVSIVVALLDALEVVQEHRDALTRTLSPSFAHRMVADLYRINDVRARFGVELSLIATVCTLLQMSIGSETILRVLRLT
jgi:hypothetical protein